MKCPRCGRAELVRETRSITYTFKGEFTSIPDVTGDFCPACTEALFDLEDSKRLNAEMLSFNKQVDAAVVDPNFVTRICNKLKLDRREAGEIFGVDVDMFSRFETGLTKPTLALVQLLRLLERHPELLDEVKAL